MLRHMNPNKENYMLNNPYNIVIHLPVPNQKNKF
jgi:hypothetical protein